MTYKNNLVQQPKVNNFYKYVLGSKEIGQLLDLVAIT